MYKTLPSSGFGRCYSTYKQVKIHTRRNPICLSKFQKRKCNNDNFFLWQFFVMVISLGTICFVFPLFLVVVVALCTLFVTYFILFRDGSREFKRFENVCRWAALLVAWWLAAATNMNKGSRLICIFDMYIISVTFSRKTMLWDWLWTTTTKKTIRNEIGHSMINYEWKLVWNI